MHVLPYNAGQLRPTQSALVAITRLPRSALPLPTQLSYLNLDQPRHQQRQGGFHLFVSPEPPHFPLKYPTLPILTSQNGILCKSNSKPPKDCLSPPRHSYQVLSNMDVELPGGSRGKNGWISVGTDRTCSGMHGYEENRVRGGGRRLDLKLGEQDLDGESLVFLTRVCEFFIYHLVPGRAAVAP